MLEALGTVCAVILAIAALLVCIAICCGAALIAIQAIRLIMDDFKRLRKINKILNR